MAGRPSKTTVDYFPHYAASGKTIFTLESLYGNDGYAFWFKLLEILCATENHCFRYENRADFLFLVAKSGVSEEKTLNILKTLADLDAIDPDLFKEKIVWCEKLISNLRPVYDKRSTEIPRKPNLRGEKRISVEKTPQSKVKESKVKNKGKKISPDFIDKKLWNDFLEHRRKLKKPMTDRAKEIFIRKLTTLKTKGFDPVELIETSIERGWQTVFEPKQNGNVYGRPEPKQPKLETITAPEGWNNGF